MVGITSYSIQNDIEFAAALKAASKKVSDLSLAFKFIATDWYKSNNAQFSLKGSGQYPPLNPVYKLRKGNKPILVSSGRLRDSVTKKSSPDTIRIIKQQGLILGTSVPYGIYHQSDAPRNRLPLRKFMFIGPEAPATAPSEITGRLQRWMSILEAETSRKLKVLNG